MAVKTKKIVRSTVHVTLMIGVLMFSWLIANLIKTSDKNINVLEGISETTYADEPHGGCGTGACGTTGGSGTTDGTGGGTSGGGK